MKYKRVLLLLCACVLILSSCNNRSLNDYDKGRLLLSEGKYSEAEALFRQSGEQASDYLKYTQAIQLGRSGEYQKAVELLRELGDFLDSREEATAYEEKAEEERQAELEHYFISGQYQAFLQNSTMESDEPMMRYAQASVLVLQQEYDQAATIFKELGNYLDSAEQWQCCEQRIWDQAYKSGEAYIRAGKWDEAVQYFSVCPQDFRDTQRYIAYVNARKLMNENRLKEAVQQFSDLGGFLDSRDYTRLLREEITESTWQQVREYVEQDSLASATDLLEELPDTEEKTKIQDYILTVTQWNELQDTSWPEETRLEKENQIIETLQPMQGYFNSSSILEAVTDQRNRRLYNRAVLCFENREYDEAYTIFSQIEQYGDVRSYESYIEAQTLADTGDTDRAISIFRELGNFRDSEQQAEILEKAQTEQIYDQAVDLFVKGDFASACCMFEQITTYRDAEQYVTYLTALEAVRKGKPNEAIELLESIPGFLDSDDWLAEIEEKQKNEMYQQSLLLLEGGDIAKAGEIWAQIYDYRDVAEYTKYAEAISAERSGVNEKAITLFTELGDFLDSKEHIAQLELQQNQQNLDSLIHALSDDRLDEALKLSFSLHGFKEAQPYISYLQARTMEKAERFEEAAAIYQANFTLLDSAERFAACHTCLNQNKLELAENALLKGNVEEARTRMQQIDDPGMLIHAQAYASALTSMEEDNIPVALEQFQALGDYLDSDEKVRQLTSVYAERCLQEAAACLKGEKTEEAESLLDSIEIHEQSPLYGYYTYLRAVLMEKRGELETAELYYTMASECFPFLQGATERIQEQKEKTVYEALARALQNKDFRTAEKWLAKTESDYKGDVYTYIEAWKFMTNGLYDQAYITWHSIPDFLDSAEMADFCGAALSIKNERLAEKAMENEQYEQAIEYLVSIPDELLSFEQKQLLKYLQARQDEVDSNWDEALEAYLSLKTYRDSEERGSSIQQVLCDRNYTLAVEQYEAGNYEQVFNLLETEQSDQGRVLRSKAEAMIALSADDCVAAFEAVQNLQSSEEYEPVKAFLMNKQDQMLIEQAECFCVERKTDEALLCIRQMNQNYDGPCYQYIVALKLMQAEKWLEANDALEVLHGYLDADSLLQECRMHLYHINDQDTLF